MRSLQKHIDIAVPREAVWTAIVERDKYERWTSAFTPGSTFAGGWNAGDTIRFLAPDADADTRSGMVSRIARADYPHVLSIEHLGEVVAGVDDTTSARVQAWLPSFETYRLERLGKSHTRLYVETDVSAEYETMMDKMWDKAFPLLKAVAEQRNWRPARVAPCVWHDGTARVAAERYAEIFPNAYVLGAGAAAAAPGESLTSTVMLGQLPLLHVNGGPQFEPNASISIFVRSGSEDDLRRWWGAFRQNPSRVYMELEPQAWSPLYGWIGDAYGLSWQLMLDPEMTPDQLPRFTPAMLFSGECFGQAEAALRKYSRLIPDADLRQLEHYPEGPFAGKVLFAELDLPGGSLIAMDGPGEHAFHFNEGVSLVARCSDQDEIDSLWDGLIADGGAPSQCGWLKDGFGVSWQVIPDNLGDLLSDPDLGQARMQALMGMQKLILADIEAAESPILP